MMESGQQELRQKIAEGLDSLQRGEGVYGDEFFARLAREEAAIFIDSFDVLRRFRLSPEAARDIREVWSYIATDKECLRLAEDPRLGHLREDLTTQAVLFWPVGAYLIVYDPKRSPLWIVRVVRGA